MIEGIFLDSGGSGLSGSAGAVWSEPWHFARPRSRVSKFRLEALKVLLGGFDFWSGFLGVWLGLECALRFMHRRVQGFWGATPGHLGFQGLGFRVSVSCGHRYGHSSR